MQYMEHNLATCNYHILKNNGKVKRGRVVRRGENVEMLSRGKRGYIIGGGGRRDVGQEPTCVLGTSA